LFTAYEEVTQLVKGNTTHIISFIFNFFVHVLPAMKETNYAKPLVLQFALSLDGHRLREALAYDQFKYYLLVEIAAI